MPNRVVREDILDSESVNKLSWPAEVFYRRLMSVVDDYGRFDARVSMLRSKLYPTKLDKVSEADVEKWMNECSEAVLVSLYRVDGKPFIQIEKFNQTLRIKKSKYPAKPFNPQENMLMQADEIICKQMRADEIMCMSEKKGNESESETEKNLNRKPENLIDFFFNDFPNSTHLVRVSAAINVDKDTLIKALPEFRKAAGLEYQNAVKFAEHFKNWYIKVYKNKPSQTIKKNQL